MATSGHDEIIGNEVAKHTGHEEHADFQNQSKYRTTTMSITATAFCGFQLQAVNGLPTILDNMGLSV
jgi:hypothetical protein